MTSKINEIYPRPQHCSRTRTSPVFSRQDSLDMVKAGMRTVSRHLRFANKHWEECYERGMPEEYALRRALLTIKEGVEASLECLDDLLDDDLKIQVDEDLRTADNQRGLYEEE